MQKIRKIASNVKKGCLIEAIDKDHILVVGPNGTGKSSVVNAIELALTGRAGDIAGRIDVGREVDLMSLANNGAPDLFALVEFDDGSRASFATSGTTAKAKKATVQRPAFVQHDDVLPIRTLREAVLGSPVTARKFLLSKVCGDMSRDDVLPFIEQEQQALYTKLVDSYPPTLAVADVLVKALEDAAARVREASSAAKESKSAASIITGGAAIPPTPADIKKAKADRDAARKVVAEIEGVSGAAEKLAAAKKAVEDANGSIEPLVAEFTAAQEALDALPAEDARGPVLRSVLDTAKASVEGGSCLVCGSEDAAVLSGTVSAIESFFADQAAARKARLAVEARFGKAKSEAEAALRKLEVAEGRLADLAGSESTGESVGSLEDAQRALADADAKLLDLQTRAGAWEAARKAQAAAVEAEKQGAEWSSLKAALTLAVAALLDKSLAAFIAKVQAGLPPTDTFDLRLKDGDREVVQFGLVHDGRLHTALSGAEWARVMAALSAACVSPDSFAVIIPEERAFDAVTLGNVMRALESSPHQVILTSPVAPIDPPDSWLVISTVQE